LEAEADGRLGIYDSIFKEGISHSGDDESPCQGSRSGRTATVVPEYVGVWLVAGFNKYLLIR
jgi:hypothetical protein